ncbi:hypothetical protein ACFLIM_32980 [Nonomuraea sp. M3C6]|uniref:Uncharacterized protein n=1 Tax=Nonomuraea marmarensis TaxID=3351344 RepID=A0ABW7AKX9_9ACTN
MNMHNDDERLDETADLPPLWPETVLKHHNDGKVPLSPPSDKLVFGPVAVPRTVGAVRAAAQERSFRLQGHPACFRSSGQGEQDVLYGRTTATEQRA